MWLVDWLIARWNRVWEVFESWYYKIQLAFFFRWTQFVNVVIDWWGAAYQFFYRYLFWLEDVVIRWYYRIREAVYDFYTTLHQALTAAWGYIWDHFWEEYKRIIDYTYSARLDIQDTFTRFKYEFQAFRLSPSRYIRDKIVERWPSFELFFADPSTYIKDRIIERWPNFEPFITDPIGYIVKKINWYEFEWNVFWENPFHWIVNKLGGDYRVWDYFIQHPAEYISVKIGMWILEYYPSLYDEYQWLTARWMKFIRAIDKFIDDPFGYITLLLQAWIEGWRDYIFGVVGDLFQSFQSLITDGLVRLVILLCPVESTGSPPLYEYDDLDTFIESMRWWLEGDGAKQRYGYDEIVEWTRKNVLKEKD